MEKLILTREELMDLKTSHKVIEFNGSEKSYEPTDNVDAALKKLYKLEQAINQGSCLVLPVPLGDTVYYIDTHLNNPIQITMNLNDGGEIVQNWEKKYFASYPDALLAAKRIKSSIQENDLIKVWDNKDDTVLRYFAKWETVANKLYCVTYPAGMNKEIYLANIALQLEYAGLERWQCFEKYEEEEQ